MLKIYIADLTHNYVIVSNETMPLGVAYIKAYLEKYLGDKVDCKLFRYPDVLIKCIKKETPDVLMLSNYVWNEALGYFIISQAKKHNPSICTIMGGPNFHLDREKQEEYLRRHFNLDFYILGEGEVPSVNIIKTFIDCNLSIERLKKYEIPSCICIKPDNSFQPLKWQPGLRDLDEIPSPWLSGYLDEFFDGNLAPIIETSRGCPFTCSYCVQGTELYNNIRRFPFDRIKEEILYIAEKINQKSPDVGCLRIADSNFGMFNDDVEVSKIINVVQRKYGWPTFIHASTGKNRKDLILKTVLNLKGALVMFNSVQSMNPVVLANIKRKDIDPVIMRDIQQQAQKIGVKTLTETILSLPGETFESHRDGLFQLIELGVKEFTNYQCMMLKGSQLETKEARDRFKIETCYRVLPRNFGVYDKSKVFEVEEVISSTGTLPFSDYLKARRLHLVLIIYYNGSRFEPLVRLLQNYNIGILSWLNLLFENMGNAGEKVVALFGDYLEETANESFDSRGSCVEFYTEEDSFQGLLRGEVGENLIMKYLSIATFLIWEDVVRYAFASAKKILNEKDVGKGVYDFLNSLEMFVCHRLASGESTDQILSNVEGPISYDINAWMNDNYCASFKKYRFESFRKAQFYLPEERYKILKNALNVYGEDIIGKTKLVTRIQYSDQLKEYRLLEVD